MDIGMLLPFSLLLLASYMDEIRRVVVFVTPACIFVAGVVFSAVNYTSTLHVWAVGVVVAYGWSRFSEYMGWWRRGDTWICTAAVAALPPTLNIMSTGYITVLFYIPVSFLIAAAYRPLYRNAESVPGVHAHTATFLILALL